MRVVQRPPSRVEEATRNADGYLPRDGHVRGFAPASSDGYGYGYGYGFGFEARFGFAAGFFGFAAGFGFGFAAGFGFGFAAGFFTSVFFGV